MPSHFWRRLIACRRRSSVAESGPTTAARSSLRVVPGSRPFHRRSASLLTSLTVCPARAYSIISRAAAMSASGLLPLSTTTTGSLLMGRISSGAAVRPSS
eukprot:5105672-Pyramimonas_sp.AAC.1